MAGSIEVKVPDIGDLKEVGVIEVLVAPGDRVEKEGSLITVESDKATMEIPSPVAGVVKELKIKVGDKVAKGSLILILDEGAGSASVAPAHSAAAAVSTTPAPAVAAVEPPPHPVAKPDPVPLEPQDLTLSKPHASPSIRMFARELGVDLSKVKGTGLKGRVTREDVQAFVKGALAAVKPVSASASGGGLPFNLPELPNIDFAKYGPVETRALSRIKKISGANLHRNWVSIPHITQFDEADITEL